MKNTLDTNNLLSAFLIIAFCLVTISCNYAKNDLQSHIDWLNTRLKSRLIREDVPFRFMDTWAAKKGLYQSSVHVNFLDKKNTWLTDKLRNSPIGDINMFVTNFVLYSQLQAQQLGTIKINEHDFSFALEALSQFRDKNSQYGIPQYIFWPQQLINGTWSAQPVNLLHLANMYPNKVPRFVNKFWQWTGLWMIEYVKDLVFSIPADNDDSSVNLALLGMMKETNSSHYEWWNNINYNKLAYYKKLLKYAYRPFDSKNQDNQYSNEIDPRTYYVIREFIEEKKKNTSMNNESPSLILPTTWLLKFDQQVFPQVQIPLGSNNVDSTVCCNVLFGLFYQVLTDQFNLNNLPQLNQMIKNTVDFLVFVVQNKIQLRPDLILVYYPSKYDFYWFLSRTVQLLKRHQVKIKQLNLEPLIYAKENLEKLMKQKGTEQVIKNKKSQKKLSNSSYWVEFMGNYAGKQRNDDAIFNTIMALSALYDTWTVRNKSALRFDSQTPQIVKSTIDQGINYLLQKMGRKMKEFNSFFSGSTKTLTTSPYNYPANVHQYHGKIIDPQTTKQEDINYAMRYIVKGTIQSEKYEQMCRWIWFEKHVPQKFNGYNEMTFPFWSSKSITQAMLISLLSKRLRVE